MKAVIKTPKSTVFEKWESMIVFQYKKLGTTVKIDIGAYYDDKESAYAAAKSVCKEFELEVVK